MSATSLPDVFKAYDIRGIYGEQIDGELAERNGYAFVAVLSGLSGKDPGALRIGLGRDLRLSAPELAARYRDGMLYWLVGSRGLDGGLMCTASHNPKAYTGAKLVREGALALSGDTGIQDVRRQVESRLGEQLPAAERRGELEQVEIYEAFQSDALRFIDPEAIRSSERRLKVVL